jgi:hypothetical protein
MTDKTSTPPDRLSTDPRSEHYDGEALQRGVGIRFKGVEKTNIEEYCVSEGWVKMAISKSRDRFGQPMAMKMSGTLEPNYRDTAVQGGADEAAAETDGTEQAD